MKSPRANLALVITIVVGLLLLWFVKATYTNEHQWLPQFIVTLVGLVGASWFVGHRLDLLHEDIHLRHAASDALLDATERRNFNDAVKEAVTMMSHQTSPPASLAGIRWLYTIASVGPAEANLVQALLCNHITTFSSDAMATTDFQDRSQQQALRLLFGPAERTRFADCADIPDLRGSVWRNLDFTGLDASGANFSDGDFTGAVIDGSYFDSADLCGTCWMSPIGGNSRTMMRHAAFHGGQGSSCTFTNVDFSEANFANNGRETLFKSCIFEQCGFEGSNWTRATFKRCTFKQCDFSDVIWTGATLESPTFELCQKITFDLCITLGKLTKPTGLPPELVARLREMGLLTDR